MTVERYHDNFLRLSADQASVLAVALQPRLPLPADASSETIYGACQSAGYDHARVVLSLARTTNPFGIGAVETLIGKPIVHGPGPTITPKMARPSASYKLVVPPKSSDLLAKIVRSVKDNPKRPGSEAHARYKHWAIGETVAEGIRRGLTMGDAKYDTSHGFVEVD
jgi:hypothetical protein